MNNCNTKGVIYKIENKVNGKVYIGQTMMEFNDRVYKHVYELRNDIHHNCHLQRAWNKHGEDNFSFIILERTSVDKLDDLEVKYISSEPKKYNFDSGGSKNKTLSQETKDKIRNSHKSKNRKYRYRRVVLLNTGRVFKTITEASNETGAHISAIASCCKGRVKSAGRSKDGEWLRWCYEEDYKETLSNGVNFNHPKEGKNNWRSRKVICVTTNKVFESISLAAKKYKINHSSTISGCCRGITKHAGKLPDGTKLKWAYYEDYKASN